MASTPVHIVERYIYELYNGRDTDLIQEICGDPMVRHSAGSAVELTRDEQLRRITADLEKHQPAFTVVTLVGDDHFASLTWNATRHTTGEKLCGIEIFKVSDGLITDVWNSNYFEGSWS